MSNTNHLVRLIDNDRRIVVGPVVLEYAGDRLSAAMTAANLRTWLERQLMGAYCRYSAELRDRLRWRSGVGAAETMEQVSRLAVDLEEVRWDNIEHKQRIEGLESELISLRGLFGQKTQELEKTVKELLDAHAVLRAIASSSSDKASRLAAEGILYRKEP